MGTVFCCYAIACVFLLLGIAAYYIICSCLLLDTIVKFICNDKYQHSWTPFVRHHVNAASTEWHKSIFFSFFLKKNGTHNAVNYYLWTPHQVNYTFAEGLYSKWFHWMLWSLIFLDWLCISSAWCIHPNFKRIFRVRCHCSMLSLSSNIWIVIHENILAFTSSLQRTNCHIWLTILSHVLPLKNDKNWTYQFIF